MTTFSRVYESVVETHTESSDDITSCYTIIGAKQTTTDNVNDTEEIQEAQIRVECDKIKFTADYLLLNNKLCGLSIDLLWINLSPLATFKAQAVTVPDMSQYAFIVIIYTLSPKYSDHGNVAIGQYGATGGIELPLVVSSSQGRRIVLFTDATTLQFDAASYNGSTSSEHGIPVKIYGIRCPINDMTEY